jgi:hypothetical protein
MGNFLVGVSTCPFPNFFLPHAQSPAGPSAGKKRCQDSFWGLSRGRRVDWRFRRRAIACPQFSSPKGEPRLTLLRTALSSAAVSGLLTRSVQRGERAIGQAESRRGSRSGSSSHRLSKPHLQSSDCLTSPAREAFRSMDRQTNNK